MALARTHREWSILIGEYNICKKKLQSKREALKILTKEWQSTQRERDIYKNKINQLQQDLDRYILKEKAQRNEKPQQNEKPQSFGVQEKRQFHVTQSNELVNITSKECVTHLLIEYKAGNKAMKKDLLELKRLYVESQEDVQILRERMRRQSSSSSIGEETTSTFVVEEREDHILQLEKYKEQVASFEQELKTIRDENSDVLIERDHYKDKCERLNIQLNYILGADDRRLVDVDALVLDNKYLKEKLTQTEEEWNIEKESIHRYEALFEKKKNILLGRGSIGRRLPSYYSGHGTDHSLKTVSELRDVANVLSETIIEKNLALSHQRSTNRILGKRVSDLENKLKTLEVAGLWSLPGHRGYGSINFGNNVASSNGEGTSKNKVVGGASTPYTGRLEWDSSPSLVELSDFEKAKMEINGNLLSDISEILDDSKKNSQNSNTLDLLHSPCSDNDMNVSRCQDDCVYRKILSHSICFEKLCERKSCSSASNSHQNNGIFHDGPCLCKNSVVQKLTRSNSAPCSLSGDSFDGDDHNGGPSCDFDAKP